MTLLAERENLHVLTQRTERIQAPCWRIGWLEEFANGLTDEQREWWDNFEGNTDYPNGLVHDETCACKGTGLQWETIRIDSFSCFGCDLDGPLAIFDATCCRQYGAGFFEELKACHEQGDHDVSGFVTTGDGPRVPWRLDQARCPLCIERLHRERALVNLLLVV